MKANGYADLERPLQISEADYSVISNFIISTLRKQHSITLSDFLDVARVQLSGKIRGDFAWSILLVKNFLEFRKVIATSKTFGDYCKPKITLARKFKMRRARVLDEVQ